MCELGSQTQIDSVEKLIIRSNVLPNSLHNNNIVKLIHMIYNVCVENTYQTSLSTSYIKMKEFAAEAETSYLLTMINDICPRVIDNLIECHTSVKDTSFKKSSSTEELQVNTEKSQTEELRWQLQTVIATLVVKMLINHISRLSRYRFVQIYNSDQIKDLIQFTLMQFTASYNIIAGSCDNVTYRMIFTPLVTDQQLISFINTVKLFEG